MGVRKRPPLTPREIGILVGVALGALAVIAGLLAADIMISGEIGGGGDFYSLWAGSRAYLLKQDSPYSGEVAALAQDLAYGRPAAVDENPYRLTTPLFLLPIFFPLGLIPSPSVARGIWLCLGQVALIGMVSTSLSIAEWRPSRLLTLLLGFVSVFGFYAVSALLAGTVAALLGLLYIATLWAVRSERQELAGGLIALSLFMWEVSAVFLILVAWRVFHEKQWRVVAGLLMTLVILLGASFLLDPRWILPFLTSVVGQVRSDYGISMVSSLSVLSPQNGPVLSRVTSVIVLVLLVFEWWSGKQGEFKRFVWLACLALAVTPLLGIRTEVNNLVVLSPCIVMIIAASLQRGRLGGVFGLVIMTAAFVVPWILVTGWLGIQVAKRDAYLFLFYPLLSIVGLYWTRWWFLRPRRTWSDEIRVQGRNLAGKAPVP